MSTLLALHRALGLGLLALAVAAAIALVGARVLGRSDGAVFRLMVLGLTSLVLLEAVLGIAQLVLGIRPRDGLHVLYGVAALLVLPVALTMARRNPRRGAFYQVGGMVLLAGVFVRLLLTA